jgi:hypothetical protein
MKLRTYIMLAAAVAATLVVASCEKEEGENETKISSYNSDESHKSGENCMNCHTSGGSDEGWFTVAGTVYESDSNTPYPNATVRLYTGPGGTGDLKATVEVDLLGNFYTTESIDFGEGLYTAVQGAGEARHMTTTISHGACNSCHGTTTDRILIP